MSMDSDIRDIKSALTDNKRSMTEMQRELQSIKNDLKKVQENTCKEKTRDTVDNNLHPLIAYAKRQLDARKQKVNLIENHPELDAFISPLGEYPHAYVLACIMDRQISAENAWIIPHNIYEAIGSFEMTDLKKLSEEDTISLFLKTSKHRYKEKMAKYFFSAVQRIANEYHSDAREIWNDEPPSGMLICRFLQFGGVGIKIATMATNILVRQFDVKLKDKSSIDVSPDIHVMRIFYRLGLISSENAKDEAIYMARALYPEYPGIVDYSCWDVGRNFCHSKTPDCSSCPFNSFCENKGK